MPFPYSLPMVLPQPEAPAYARQLKQLLPPGRLWLLEAGRKLSALLLGVGAELARVEQRGQVLMRESDPRTATETLPEWEEMLGLPDEDIIAIPATVAARRLAIVQKLVTQAGVKPAYFVSLAAACGYTATVHEYFNDVLRAGFLVGAACYAETPWANVFRLDVTAPAGTALTHAELEAVVSRAAPAHTYVLFNYL